MEARYRRRVLGMGRLQRPSPETLTYEELDDGVNMMDPQKENDPLSSNNSRFSVVAAPSLTLSSSLSSSRASESQNQPPPPQGGGGAAARRQQRHLQQQPALERQAAQEQQAPYRMTLGGSQRSSFNQFPETYERNPSSPSNNAAPSAARTSPATTPLGESPSHRFTNAAFPPSPRDQRQPQKEQHAFHKNISNHNSFAKSVHTTQTTGSTNTKELFLSDSVFKTEFSMDFTTFSSTTLSAGSEEDDKDESFLHNKDTDETPDDESPPKRQQQPKPQPPPSSPPSPSPFTRRQHQPPSPSSSPHSSMDDDSPLRKEAMKQQPSFLRPHPHDSPLKNEQPPQPSFLRPHPHDSPLKNEQSQPSFMRNRQPDDSPPQHEQSHSSFMRHHQPDDSSPKNEETSPSFMRHYQPDDSPPQHEQSQPSFMTHHQPDDSPPENEETSPSFMRHYQPEDSPVQEESSKPQPSFMRHHQPDDSPPENEETPPSFMRHHPPRSESPGPMRKMMLDSSPEPSSLPSSTAGTPIAEQVNNNSHKSSTSTLPFDERDNKRQSVEEEREARRRAERERILRLMNGLDALLVETPTNSDQKAAGNNPRSFSNNIGDNNNSSTKPPIVPTSAQSTPEKPFQTAADKCVERKEQERAKIKTLMDGLDLLLVDTPPKSNQKGDQETVGTDTTTDDDDSDSLKKTSITSSNIASIISSLKKKEPEIATTTPGAKTTVTTASPRWGGVPQPATSGTKPTLAAASPRWGGAPKCPSPAIGNNNSATKSWMNKSPGWGNTTTATTQANSSYNGSPSPGRLRSLSPSWGTSNRSPSPGKKVKADSPDTQGFVQDLRRRLSSNEQQNRTFNNNNNNTDRDHKNDFELRKSPTDELHADEERSQTSHVAALKARLSASGLAAMAEDSPSQKAKPWQKVDTTTKNNVGEERRTPVGGRFTPTSSTGARNSYTGMDSSTRKATEEIAGAEKSFPTIKDRIKALTEGSAGSVKDESDTPATSKPLNDNTNSRPASVNSNRAPTPQPTSAAAALTANNNRSEAQGAGANAMMPGSAFANPSSGVPQQQPNAPGQPLPFPNSNINQTHATGGVFGNQASFQNQSSYECINGYYQHPNAGVPMPQLSQQQYAQFHQHMQQAGYNAPPHLLHQQQMMHYDPTNNINGALIHQRMTQNYSPFQSIQQVGSQQPQMQYGMPMQRAAQNHSPFDNSQAYPVGSPPQQMMHQQQHFGVSNTMQQQNAIRSSPAYDPTQPRQVGSTLVTSQSPSEEIGRVTAGSALATQAGNGMPANRSLQNPSPVPFQNAGSAPLSENHQQNESKPNSQYQGAPGSAGAMESSGIPLPSPMLPPPRHCRNTSKGDVTASSRPPSGAMGHSDTKDSLHSSSQPDVSQQPYRRYHRHDDSASPAPLVARKVLARSVESQEAQFHHGTNEIVDKNSAPTPVAKTKHSRYHRGGKFQESDQEDTSSHRADDRDDDNTARSSRKSVSRNSSVNSRATSSKKRDKAVTPKRERSKPQRRRESRGDSSRKVQDDDVTLATTTVGSEILGSRTYSSGSSDEEGYYEEERGGGSGEMGKAFAQNVMGVFENMKFPNFTNCVTSTRGVLENMAKKSEKAGCIKASQVLDSKAGAQQRNKARTPKTGRRRKSTSDVETRSRASTTSVRSSHRPQPKQADHDSPKKHEPDGLHFL